MDRIDQLRVFVRLVERGSFSAVADELGVGQSTVSKWLAGLEDDLGTRLLDRTTRSQHVTESGQSFYQRAAAILDGYDTAVGEVKEGESVVRGRIRMSLPVVFGRLYVLPLMIRFLRKHQELRLQLSFSDRYVNLVEEGYDLVLRLGASPDSTLREHVLGSSTRKLVASPKYLGGHGVPKTPGELAEHQCLVHTGLGARTTWTLSKAGTVHRVGVEGRVFASNSEATLTLAKSGFGICMLASWLVDRELERGRLVQVLRDYELPPAPIRALTAPGRHLSPRLRALLDHLGRGLGRSLPTTRPC